MAEDVPVTLALRKVTRTASSVLVTLPKNLTEEWGEDWTHVIFQQIFPGDPLVIRPMKLTEQDHMLEALSLLDDVRVQSEQDRKNALDPDARALFDEPTNWQDDKEGPS